MPFRFLKSSSLALAAATVLGCNSSSSFFSPNKSDAPKPKLSPKSDIETTAPAPPEGLAPSSPTTEVFEAQARRISIPTDVIFVVDTSGSMDDEKANIETNMADFIGKFFSTGKDMEVNLHVIGNNFKFATADASKISLVSVEIGSNDALTVLQKFLSGDLNTPKPLRRDSLKQIVIISDDDAVRRPVKNGEIPGESRSVMPGSYLTTVPLISPAAAFKAFVTSRADLKNNVSVNALIGLPTTNTTDVCTIESIGHQYMKLGSDPEIGGLIQDLCVENWGVLFDNLAAKIIIDVASRDFVLSRPADSARPIGVTIDGNDAEASDYKYNAKLNAIVFEKNRTPNGMAKITVTYTPKN